MQDLILEVAKFLKKEEEKFNSIEELLNEETFFEEKLRITKFINEILNKNKLSKWQIRDLVAKTFEQAVINLETDNIRKILFLILTDVINERTPSPSPLYFPYHNHKIPKRHAIITDFNLYTFLKERANQLNPEKKHIILFSIWEDGSLIKEGVSYYLSVFDYLLFLLLDKALYEELIPIDEILGEKDKFLTVNEKNLGLLLNLLFSSLYEFYTGKKETLSILNKEKTKYLIKAKKFVKETLSDKKEEKYLLNLAKDDEFLSENRKKYLKQEDVQKQIFDEAKQRQVSEIDKIDAVIWLIGLENISPKVLFENFSIEDFIKFLQEVEKDIETGKEYFYEGLKRFLVKLFETPKLFDESIDTNYMENLIKDNLKDLYPDYLFWKKDYENFLNEKLYESPNNDLKKLYAKYKTGQIDEKEFKNWLLLFENKEEINKDLLNFVKIG